MENQEILIEIIKIIPSVFIYFIIGILLLKLYRPFVQQLLPKLANFKAFGVEIGFIKKELKAATHDYGMKFNDAKGQALLKRLEKYDRTKEVQILWIDDNIKNNQTERKILSNLGMISDFAASSEEARIKIKKNHYDLLISDIFRKDNPMEGVEFLKKLHEEDIPFPPCIFNIAKLERDKGIPPYTFGITNNPVELFHLVLDALARRL